MDICFLVDSRVVATTGLLMDIAGIVLLFRYGAIGGDWINAPTRPKYALHYGVKAPPAGSDDDPKTKKLANERNKRMARWGAATGLGLAVTGFAMQLVAQWM